MARHSCGGLDCHSNVSLYVRSWLGNIMITDVTMDSCSCSGHSCQSKFRPHGRSRRENLPGANGYVRCAHEH
eukprot:5028199-Heterocapsa_arctica.AAC.1